MSSYELYIEKDRYNRNFKTGCFLKGCTPWNKGKTWKQMGIGKKKQKKMRANLEKGRCGRKDIGGSNKRAVIAVFPDGTFQFYPSASAAGRAHNICGRNITSTCHKKRKTCGGIRWFFENDNEWTKLVSQ